MMGAQHWPTAATRRPCSMLNRPPTANWNTEENRCRWLTMHIYPLITPKPRRVSKNLINKSCRSTCKLQLWLSDLGLIRAGLQIATRPCTTHETTNQFYIAKFQSWKIAFCWFLWTLFDHVRHRISSWPKNKSCCSNKALQLCLRVHFHANNLCYSST